MKPLISPGSAAAFAVCSLACALAPVQAGEVARKSYDIAAGDAVSTLKRFADESGRQVMFLVDAVRGVTTNPVRGEYTVREALTRLVADTGMVVAEDAKSGALMVNRLASREPPPSPPKPQPKTPPMKSSRTLLAAFVGWLAAAGAAEAQTATPPSTEETVTLSPFQVTTDKDYGYQTLSTASGSRTNQQLRDIPAPITVLNAEFLKDVGATNFYEALEYAIGVSPSNANYIPGVGPASGVGDNSYNVRGIKSSWAGRDGFRWVAPSDNFGIERLEIGRGANGQMFGDARAGGVVSLVSKRPKSRDFIEAGTRFDSEGSQRYTLDLSRKIGAKGGIRFNTFYSDQRAWKDTAFDQRSGVALSGAYDLTRNTTLRVMAERGSIDMTPTKGAVAESYNLYTLGTGTVAPGANPVGTQLIRAAGTTQQWINIDGKSYNLISAGASGATTPGNYFRQTTASALTQGLVPESMIPRTQQWNGPSERFDNDYYVYVASIEHRFSDNLFVEAGVNLQRTERQDLNSALSQARFDPNPSLPGPNGTLVANPHYNEAYLEHQWAVQRFGSHDRQYRITSFYNLPALFTHSDIFGMKHKLIGEGSLRDENFEFWNGQELLTPQAISALGFTGVAGRQTSNRLTRRYYLKDGNGSKLERKPVTDFDTYQVPGGFQQRVQLYSARALLLGSYWKDRIQTSVGIRRDDYENQRAAILTDPLTGLGFPEVTAQGQKMWREYIGTYHTSKNYGAVFSPLRQFRLFANYSESFTFNSTALLFNGDPNRAFEGDGKDWGASVYLFDDRLNATVTFFRAFGRNETFTVTSAPVANEINALLNTTGFIAGSDTRDRQTKGYELELTANLTRNWTLSYKYTNNDQVWTNFAPRLSGVLDRMKQATTDANLYRLTQAAYDAALSSAFADNKNWNLSTRYTFTKGALKGVRAGAYGFWRPTRNFIVTGRPNYVQPSYLLANLFVGYNRRIGQKVVWDAQLNVENLLDNQMRVGTSYVAQSYLAPRKFILQNGFTF